MLFFVIAVAVVESFYGICKLQWPNVWCLNFESSQSRAEQGQCVAFLDMTLSYYSWERSSPPRNVIRYILANCLVT